MIHIGINPRALWEAYTENLNPQVVNRKTVLRKKRENGLIGAFPAALGLNVKIILSQGRLLPAL